MARDAIGEPVNCSAIYGRASSAEIRLCATGETSGLDYGYRFALGRWLEETTAMFELVAEKRRSRRLQPSSMPDAGNVAASNGSATRSSLDQLWLEAKGRPPSIDETR